MAQIISETGTSNVVIVLLAGILIALVALIVLIGTRGSNSSQTQTSSSQASEETKKPAIKEIKPGESVTREELKSQGAEPSKPSQEVDHTRLVQTFLPGRRYRHIAKCVMESRASNKDWGIETVLNMHYAAEFEIHRQIESNDGQTIIEVREFSKARNITVYCQVEDVHFDVGGRGQMILGGLDLWYMKPGLWSSIQGTSAKQLLDLIPGAQDWANKVASDQMAKTFAFIDSLQGKKVRLEYVNGEGVKKISGIGCSLSGSEQALICDTAVVSDCYILPDLDSKEGATWTLQGTDLLPIIDPSLRSSLVGSLTVTRGKTVGDETKLMLTQGMLDLCNSDAKTEAVGKWAPRGEMTFSFKDKVVTQGRLGGSITFEKRSKDHILFASELRVKPDYVVTYSCDIEP